MLDTTATDTKALIISDAIGDAMARIDQYIAGEYTFLKTHGRGECSIHGCTCISDTKAHIRVLKKTKEALCIASPYIW